MASLDRNALRDAKSLLIKAEWRIYASVNNHHWFRQCFAAWAAPSHSLNQYWNIVNWALRNKLQWNLNRNLSIFIQENALENVVCEMASILSRPQCVLTGPMMSQLYRLRHYGITRPQYVNPIVGFIFHSNRKVALSEYMYMAITSSGNLSCCVVWAVLPNWHVTVATPLVSTQ